MNGAQIESAAKAAQAIGLQLNGLLSTHQKSTTSYSALVTNIGQGTLALEPKMERKALKQMEKTIKLTEDGIKKLARINELLSELEKSRAQASKGGNQ